MAERGDRVGAAKKGGAVQADARTRPADLAARIAAVIVFLVATFLLFTPSLAPFGLAGGVSTRVVTEVAAGPTGTTTRTVRTTEELGGRSGVVAGSVDNPAGILVLRLG